MHTKEQLQNMLAEHNEWQTKISQFKDELKKMNTELSQVVTKETPAEVKASVEHFQNQFIRQREVLDIIRHEFKQHENLVQAAEKNELTESDLNKQHVQEREKLEQFDRIFNDLEREFESFLQKA